MENNLMYDTLSLCKLLHCNTRLNKFMCLNFVNLCDLICFSVPISTLIILSNVNLYIPILKTNKIRNFKFKYFK